MVHIILCIEHGTKYAKALKGTLLRSKSSLHSGNFGFKQPNEMLEKLMIDLHPQMFRVQLDQQPLVCLFLIGCRAWAL